MYLLDTQALSDLLDGDENASRRFVASAEKLSRTVHASLISFGIIKASIDEISDPVPRETWDRRFSVGLNMHRANNRLVGVDENTIIEWALLRNLKLPIDDQEELGDDERLVVATAIIRRLVLVTSTPDLYAPAASQRGLLVQGI